jgi:hypothetical protein
VEVVSTVGKGRSNGRGWSIIDRVIDDVRVFADIYATGPDVALGTGALWAFTRDMQIDLGTYAGLNGEEPVATPFVGFSIQR